MQSKVVHYAAMVQTWSATVLLGAFLFSLPRLMLIPLVINSIILWTQGKSFKPLVYLAFLASSLAAIAVSALNAPSGELGDHIKSSLSMFYAWIPWH